MNELIMIKNFLNKRIFDSYSISQICDHLNHLSVSKKYTLNDVLLILSCYDNSKYLDTNSYINYCFFHGPLKKINVSPIDETTSIILDKNKFIQFQEIFKEQKKPLIVFLLLFGISAFFPNFFLTLFLILFFYLVHKFFPIPNLKIGIPIFLGLYPFVYGIFNYSEYISKEFSFLGFIMLFPKKMVLFDERIDLMYLNYLTLTVSFFIMLMILLLKAVFNYNKKDGIDMFFYFLIVFVVFIGQNVWYYSISENEYKQTYHIIKFIIAFNLMPLIAGHIILLLTVKELNNLSSEKKISLIFVCILFLLGFIAIVNSGKNLIEHYYSTINISNKDYCRNIDEDFKIIKNSKKIGFIVVDSESFNKDDVYSYIHFNNNMELKSDFLMNHKKENFNNYVSYNLMVKYYNKKFVKNNTIEYVNKTIKPENKKNHAIIEQYINSNPRDRFFYYKCK
jgi:hypothetical protein